MPSWYIHELIDEILTGKKHKDVHYFLDVPGVILNNGYIKGHRSKWGHSIEYAVLTYLLTKDIDKTISALAHIVTDNMISYKEGKELEKVVKLLKLLLKR